MDDICCTPKANLDAEQKQEILAEVEAFLLTLGIRIEVSDTTGEVVVEVTKW